MRTVQEALDAHIRQREACDYIKEYLRTLKLTYVESFSVLDAANWELHRENEERE